MSFVCRLPLISLSIVIAFTQSVFAANPISVQKMSIKNLQHIIQLKLTTDKKSKKTMSLSSVPKSSLQLVEQHTDSSHITHARMQQEYAGFPVFGGYIVLHSLASDNLTNPAVQMNGVIYDELEQELRSPPKNYETNAANALGAFLKRHQEGKQSQSHVLPIIYLDNEHHAHWAYQVSVLIEYEHAIPQRPTAIVDAQTFVPFIQWNDIKTMNSFVKGMGYGGNEHTGLYQYGKEFPLLDLTRNAKAGLCYLDNEHVKVVNMRHHEHDVLNAPVSFLCGDEMQISNDTYWTGLKGDGYNQLNGAYSPENDALYIGTVIHQMYRSWYGVHALEKNNRPMKLVMRLHFDKEYENAFWDGTEMTFGDGGKIFYPLVSLSVGAHEISHGFTEQHSGLIYYGESGAINESFSDMAAQAAEYYAKGTCSWRIGEEIIKETSGFDALRYLDDPTRDGLSIAYAIDYDKGMDVHYASGVYNHLFYLLATQPGWTPRRAFHVMVKANMDYWTPFSTFAQAACGILSAAKDLNDSTDDVKKVLSEVMIDYNAC